MDKQILFHPINKITGYYPYSVPGEIIDTGKTDRYYLVVTEDGGLTWVFQTAKGEYLESDPLFDEDDV